MGKTKLRKMLGSPTTPEVVDLMRLIETQSKSTLAAWAATYAREHYLPILSAHELADERLAGALATEEAWASGEATLKDVRARVRDAQTAAREAVADPVVQAAARAIATASAVAATPTGALGFTFYGVAAVAYDELGLEAAPDAYDARAREEFARILSSLEKAAVADEPNPVRVDWNC